MGASRVDAIRPTRRAALIVALIGVATIVVGAAETFVVVVGLMVAGAFALDVILVLRLRPTVERSHAPTLPLGVAHPFRLDVRASTVSSTRVRQPLPASLVATPDECEGTSLVGTLRGRHRGRHLVPPAVVRMRGPIGLAARDVASGGATSVVVVPDLPRARRLAAARRRGAGLVDGRVRSRVGIGTEFETIRDYAPDDDIRQVNWVASSRTGHLMSNQYRVDESRDVVCLVDTGRLMASPIGEVTRLDVALDALAILCVEAEAAQDRVGALAFADDVQRSLSPRRFGTSAIVDALFDLEPTEIESDYDVAFAAVGRHKRALVVVFTDLVDETASRALLSACQVLRRRHAIMVVTCADPDLARAVDRDPRVETDVLRAAVALDLLSAKNRVAHLLTAMGVVVVEAPPARLGPACVRAYFTLKSRARA